MQTAARSSVPDASVVTFFVASSAVTVVGFWPSFFSQLRTTDMVHMVHGMTATLWTAVPVLQVWLIRKRYFRLHRMVGRVAVFVIAPVLVLSALHMVQLMIIGDSTLLNFAFLDLGALVLFVVFLALAVAAIRRGDARGHERYLMATVMFALEPVLERVFVFFVPGVDGFQSALFPALASMEIIVAGFILQEWRSGRVRAPLPIALVFFLLMHTQANPAAKWGPIAGFANWFASI
jgi:uncharacterized membrane protein